jgi:hypothetical protein
MPLAPHGYFIEVVSPQGGVLGGLVGADALCLSELTSRTWLDQTTAVQRGQLVATKVHAWLCSLAACRDLVPGDRYQYASTVNTSRGGASFVATVDGFLPDDGHAYGDVDVFGLDDSVHEYITGRTQSNAPQTTTCGDWTTGTPQTDVAVNDTAFYPERLEKYPKPCFVAPGFHLICVVDR